MTTNKPTAGEPKVSEAAKKYANGIGRDRLIARTELGPDGLEACAAWDFDSGASAEREAILRRPGAQAMTAAPNPRSKEPKMPKTSKDVSKDWADEIAEEKLPCSDRFGICLGAYQASQHPTRCPAYYRPAVAAALREAYRRGVKETEQNMQMGWA